MGRKRNRLIGFHFVAILLLSCWAITGFAANLLQTEEEFLEVDDAFQLTATANSGQEIQLYWTIAEGYYLYRDRVSVSVVDGDARLGEVQLPPGKEKHDEFFGDVEIYEHSATATVPVTNSPATANIQVSYQGCAHAGLCYPPVKKSFSLDLPNSNNGLSAVSVSSDTGSATNGSEQGQIAAKLGQQNITKTIYVVFYCRLVTGVYTLCISHDPYSFQHYRWPGRAVKCGARL